MFKMLAPSNGELNMTSCELPNLVIYSVRNFIARIELFPSDISEVMARAPKQVMSFGWCNYRYNLGYRLYQSL